MCWNVNEQNRNERGHCGTKYTGWLGGTGTASVTGEFNRKRMHRGFHPPSLFNGDATRVDPRGRCIPIAECLHKVHTNDGNVWYPSVANSD